MIPALLTLLLTASAPDGCGDSTYVDAEEGLLAITPDAAWQDSCAWEALRTQNGESDHGPDRASARASFSLAQTQGSPVKSIARHQARGNGWNNRIELQDGSLVRRQLGWNEKGWRVLAGDLNDTSMPLWPRWLPRRTLPAGWSAAPGSQPFLPITSIPQGLGAGVFSGRWKAYAVSGWEPVQSGGTPPWEKPWELHPIAGGASVSLPWIASLQFLETRITRNGADSVADQLLALGVATPHEVLALQGAWASSRQNPNGGFALGTIWTQRFSNSSRLQITLRQRSRTWTSSWDPTVPEDAEQDSDAVVGAGEGNALLRIPFNASAGKGATTSEIWAAWNPEASTRKLGARGAVEWHRRDTRFELRTLHREWTYASGTTGFHNFLAFETGLGRTPDWRAGAYRIWEKTGSREGLSLAADTRWKELRIRPGVLIESDKDQEVSTSASLWMHWRIERNWRLETDGSTPVSDFALNQLRWRATLRFVR